MIVVFGAVRSITQVKLAGDGSVLLPMSVARTSKVCVPAVKPVKFRGLVQVANAAVSNRHWNVLPASFEVNVKLALVLLGNRRWIPGDARLRWRDVGCCDCPVVTRRCRVEIPRRIDSAHLKVMIPVCQACCNFCGLAQDVKPATIQITVKRAA